MARERPKPKPHTDQKAFWWLHDPPKSLQLVVEIAVILIGILELVLGRHEFLGHGWTGLLKPLGVVVGVVLWLLCLRIYLSRRSEFPHLKVYKYSQRKRHWAAVILIVISMISVGLFVVDQILQKEFVVLVADFDGPDPKHYRVTEILLQQLRRGLEREQNLRVEALGEPVTEKSGSEQAQKLGARRHAAMVLWGWYAANEGGGALITVHVELTRGPTILEHQSETINVAIPELKTFSIQFKLAREMTALTMLILGAREVATGDFSRAITHLTGAISQENNPDQIISPESVYLLRALAYFGASQFDNALEDYGRALNLNSKLSTAWNNRCAIHTAMHEWSEALKECNQAIEIDDPCCRAQAYCNRGNIEYSQGQLQLAIEDYSRAIQLRPTMAVDYNLRGEAFRKLGQINQALDDFSKAIHLNSHYPNPYNNRGIIYSQNLKDYKRAICDFNRALKYRPDYPQAYYNRGATYGYLGNVTQEISDYQQAIKIYPDYFEAHVNLGYRYAEMSDFRAAIKEVKTAVTLTDDSEKRQELVSLLEVLETADRAAQKQFNNRSTPPMPR